MRRGTPLMEMDLSWAPSPNLRTSISLMASTGRFFTGSFSKRFLAFTNLSRVMERVLVVSKGRIPIFAFRKLIAENRWMFSESQASSINPGKPASFHGPNDTGISSAYQALRRCPWLSGRDSRRWCLYSLPMSRKWCSSLRCRHTGRG